MNSIAERRKIEVEFWRDSDHERPGADSLDNQLDKSADAYVFREAMRPFDREFSSAHDILELGGGQGWASCVVKRLYPTSRVTTSDISPFAVASKSRWERIYDVSLDGAASCTSDDLPFPDTSIDLAFCFAAAHHFVTHGETLCELNRVLRPGGCVIYFYEPASPAWLYTAAVNRVNRKRPDVPEDVLVPSRLRKQAEQAGLEFELHRWPVALKRSRGASIYYATLGYLPLLCNLLPCTTHFVFRKQIGQTPCSAK